MALHVSLWTTSVAETGFHGISLLPLSSLELLRCDIPPLPLPSDGMSGEETGGSQGEASVGV